jgi:tripartite-type tricarboxylate transporter receptor subunit TctC
MACLLFNQALGIRPTSVAYRGTGPAMNDLVGGHVDFLCEQSVSVAEQIKAGAVKAYVVSANQRLPTLPDIPSAKEGGINYQMSIWAGIFAPKGTPKEIIAKLSAALDKALDDPSVRKRLSDLGGFGSRQAGENTGKFRAAGEGGNCALVPHSESCISDDELTHRKTLIAWSGTNGTF